MPLPAGSQDGHATVAAKGLAAAKARGIGSGNFEGTEPGVASVDGVDDGAGYGVKGQSATGSAVAAEGGSWAGLTASATSGSAVSAFSDSGAGILSVSNSGAGVDGSSGQATGVRGHSDQGAGVVGDGPAYAGVVASSVAGSGVSAFSDTGAGILTLTHSGPAVSARSIDGVGVDATSDRGTALQATAPAGVAVLAESQTREAVSGTTAVDAYAGVLGVNSSAGAGVLGRSGGPGGTGVVGTAGPAGGTGVRGDGDDGAGVLGVADTGSGVVGTSNSGAGVQGRTVDGVGVHGRAGDEHDDLSGSGRGVLGEARSATAVEGQSRSGVGVWGESQYGEGVHGVSSSRSVAAVAGIQLNPASTGAGVYGEHRGSGPAGFFHGNVVVQGDIAVTGHLDFVGADFAEEFRLAGSPEADGADEAGVDPDPAARYAEPGTVMVIDSDQSLRPSSTPYDRRVAGVVTGAGDLRPGVVLGRDPLDGGPLEDGSRQPRVAVALMGRTYCLVDASYGAVETGDLLTTSPTAGHAMRATEPTRAFGAVLGKALRPLAAGQGLVPILVTLQ